MGSHWPLVILSLAVPLACAVPLGSLYPHGVEVQDNLLQSVQDAQAPEVTLKVPIKFYDESYSSIYVNEFGCLTFRASLPQFISIPFPLDYPSIAPLYSNVDIRNSGRIYYRETEDGALLQRADEDVARSFPNFAGRFKAKSLFVATWSEVGYNVDRAEKVNTFQVVVISDGEESFVEFLYADNGIQWIQGVPTDQSGFPDAKAQAGLMQDNNLYSLPNSGTDQVFNLDKISNTETPGQWIFRVGSLASHGSPNIDAPVAKTQVTRDATCDLARVRCHSNADCVDDATGYCCVCKAGYYGNGINCLSEDKPLRLNGKFSLDVNGVIAKDIDLQSYIAVADGRHYTVLTKLPPMIGASLQLASSMANGVGWLFAKSVSAPNGYQISGGVYNYSAELMFTTGQRLSVQQEFTGHDVFDQLTLTGSIRGSIPVILPGTRVQIEDTQQEYTHSAPGLFQSQSSVTYQLPDNNPPQVSLRLIQTIQYSEACPSKAKNITNFKIRATKNMIVFENRESNLRVASTNKISSMNLNDDPCKNFFCVANSSCVVEDDRPTCLCNKGFQQLYTEDRRQEDFGCFDINECNEGRDNCDQNAICFNEIGSFSCQCKPGYAGNGHQCTEVRAPQTPSPSPCEADPRICNPPNSSCTDPSDYRTCSCNPGFQKDYIDDRLIGFVCTDIDECLNYPNPCNNNGECINRPGSFHCADGNNEHSGYSGDPASATCDNVRCQENAECIEDPTTGPHCNCVQGFSSNGKTCVSLDKLTCDFAQNCGYNAQCILNEAVGVHVCVCDDGYVGDGYTCTTDDEKNQYKVAKMCVFNNCMCPKGYVESGASCIPQEEESATSPYGVPCNTKTSCHPNAQCVYMTHAQEYLCQCNAGYDGDGAHCESTSASPTLDCFQIDNCHHQASCQYVAGSTTRASCVCNAGYTGDGVYNCDAIVSSSSVTIPCSERDEPLERKKEDGLVEQYFESNSSIQCGPNAYCTDNFDTKQLECVCHDGFYRDGEFCRSERVEDTDDDCDTACHRYAQCLSDDNELKEQSKCKCNVGYTGDGVYECVEDSLGCNVVKNCHANAECLYNETSAGYRCQCTQGYVGNGIECHPVKTCMEDRTLCAKDASCVTGTQGHFHCECNEGFTGNGFACKPVHKKESDFLLVNQGMAMMRIPYQPTRSDMGRPIHMHRNQMLIGIAVDCVEGLVYYSAIADKSTIKRSYFDGKNVEDAITTNIGSPEGLTIDWLQRVLYWTDSKHKTIAMAQLGGSQPSQTQVIVKTGLVNPRGIAVHPYYQKLFWSDWNKQSPKIEWSNLDGTNREIFLQAFDLKLPNSLAIDFSRDELCWVDAGVKSLECASIHTRERRTVVPNCTYPFGLSITDDKYYWTDWGTYRVESATKSGEKSTSIPLTQMGTSFPYGIAAVPSRCPRT